MPVSQHQNPKSDIEIAQASKPRRIVDVAKEKLRAYGIAPPLTAGEPESLVPLRRRLAVPCPFCASHDTTQKSEFGSTACKAIFVCNDCRQPFDYFKAI